MADRFLCLDCATRTGWATDALCTVESGVEDFSANHPGKRTSDFRLWLARKARGLFLRLPAGDDLVLVYEQPHGRGYAASRVAHTLTGCVDEVAYTVALRFRVVHSASIKRFATGSGNATKAQMLVAINHRREGAPITDDNEADALHLLRFAQAGFPESTAHKQAQHRAKTSPRRKADPTEDLVLTS